MLQNTTHDTHSPHTLCTHVLLINVRAYHALPIMFARTFQNFDHFSHPLGDTAPSLARLRRRSSVLLCRNCVSASSFVFHLYFLCISGPISITTALSQLFNTMETDDAHGSRKGCSLDSQQNAAAQICPPDSLDVVMLKGGTDTGTLHPKVHDHLISMRHDITRIRNGLSQLVECLQVLEARHEQCLATFTGSSAPLYSPRRRSNSVVWTREESHMLASLTHNSSLRGIEKWKFVSSEINKEFGTHRTWRECEKKSFWLMTANLRDK